VAEPAPLDLGATLDALVKQFADPMSFLRELVQNAIDAGSREIDIYIEYRQSDGGAADQPGVMVIHVDDFGEGMTREIIDTQLTRLFSSSKEGDQTKFGKFGIGFVSVFAIAPDAVCVDTARGNERWRVMFRRDRTFTRIALATPVEGTKIQVIKAVTPKELDDYRRRARETLVYWCKHAGAEIRFEGAVISQPLDVESPCKVNLRVQVGYDEDVRIVAGYTADGSSFGGFYNQGLTLFEAPSPADAGAPPAPLLAGIAFKVVSRALEHTLTRDNVVASEHFDKVMARVTEVAERELRQHLLATLAAALAHAPRASESQLLCRLATMALRDGPAPAGIDDLALFRDIFGRSHTVKALRKAAQERHLVWDSSPNPLSLALSAAEFVVVHAAMPDERPLLSRVVGTPVLGAAEAFFLSRPRAAEALPAYWPGWCEVIRALFGSIGAKIADVALCDFEPAETVARRPVAVTQSAIGALTPHAERQGLADSFWSRPRVLAIDADHPSCARLLGLARAEPEWAAYLLVKLFLLEGGLSEARDAKLVACALKLRQQRVAGDATAGAPS
jgi:hypothetical protein